MKGVMLASGAEELLPVNTLVSRPVRPSLDGLAQVILVGWGHAVGGRPDHGGCRKEAAVQEEPLE